MDAYLNQSGLTYYHIKVKEEISSTTSGLVPDTRTVNGRALSEDITLSSDDIGITVNKRVLIVGNASGDCAIAIGVDSNAIDTEGIAIGRHAISRNASAIAIGSFTDAYEMESIAIGASANVRGTNGIAIGSGAEVSTNASRGIAIGSWGITANAEGAIAIGNGVVKARETAIAIGYFTKAIGVSSLAFGYYANANAGSSIAMGGGAEVLQDAEKSCAIGAGAVCSTPNTIQLGNASSLSKLSCKVSLSVTSDERDKTDITPIDDGAVEFLNKIQAIRYVFNGRELYIDDDENLLDVEKDHKAKYGMCSYDKEAHALGTKKGERVRVGVLAQEVQKALEEVYGDKSYANLVDDNFFDFDKSTIPEGVENKLSLTYENFIPFLIKAVQELDTRVKILEEYNK